MIRFIYTHTTPCSRVVPHSCYIHVAILYHAAYILDVLNTPITTHILTVSYPEIASVPPVATSHMIHTDTHNTIAQKQYPRCERGISENLHARRPMYRFRDIRFIQSRDAVNGVDKWHET
jgi:hypothetical protein